MYKIKKFLLHFHHEDSYTNINGLECKKKKSIELFKQFDLDILCLQEKHKVNSETINFIEKQSPLVSYQQILQKMQ